MSLDTERIENELVVTLQNDINSYLYYALPLCVILSDNKFQSWFFEHYIQIASIIYANGNMGCQYVDGVTYDFRRFYDDVIELNSVGSIIIKYNLDIIEYIRDCIDAGYYLVIFADEYYLPQKLSFNKKHFVHDSLIYGYDNEKQQIKAIAFDIKHKFNKILYNYEQYKKAFRSGCQYYKESGIHWMEGRLVNTIKQNKFIEDYPFSIGRFLKQLRNYLDSVIDNKSEYFLRLIETGNEQVKYGIDVYDMFTCRLEELLRENKISGLGYPTVHFLYEHKQGIFKRLKYITSIYKIDNNLAELIGEYQKIVDKINMMRNIFLKCMYVNREDESTFSSYKFQDNIRKIIDILNSVKEEESIILAAIYKKLVINKLWR